jgi:tetratricopeptide (TPR) repeat protein
MHHNKRHKGHGLPGQMIRLAAPLMGLLILVVSLLSFRSDLPEQLRLNATLVCLLGEGGQLAMQGGDSPCLDQAGWRRWSNESLTFASIYHRMRFNSRQGIQADNCGDSLCDCELPEFRPTQVDRLDPRSRLMTYYVVHAAGQQSGTLPDVRVCTEHLPSSSYLLSMASAYEATSGKEDLAPRTVEIAYLADHGWIYPAERATTAFRQGEAYQLSGEVARARVAYESAIRRFTDLEHPNRQLFIAQSYQRLADMAAGDGDWEEASTLYEQSMQVMPERASEVADAYIDAVHEIRVGGAQDHILSFLREQPGNEARIVHALSTSLARRGNIAEAESVIEVASSTMPGNPFLLAARATVANSAGDHATSHRLLEEAINQQKDAEPRVAAGWAAQLARQLRAQGDLQGAIKAQGMATLLDPQRQFHWYSLALLHQQNADLEAARAALKQALERDPANSTFLQLQEQLGE